MPKTPDIDAGLHDTLGRIADALERMSPAPARLPDLASSTAYVWAPGQRALRPVKTVSTIPLQLLKGIDSAADQLLRNTMQFAQGLPANNVLLWGARGMGKSSLIKSVCAEITDNGDQPLRLIEIHREEIESLPDLLALLEDASARFIVYCDDLSFDAGDTSYKSLKAVLEGGLQGRPANVLFYATSNRRHLLPRDMMENERATAINPGEAVEEKVSLSDRFGLWIGFHNCSQETYLEMVFAYANHFELGSRDDETIRAEALEWSITRGARSGRVAWQYIQDLAGRTGKPLHL
ncbi:MAG: ATP-binding protein [Pseudomonadota bacterium]